MDLRIVATMNSSTSTCTRAVPFILDLVLVRVATSSKVDFLSLPPLYPGTSTRERYMSVVHVLPMCVASSACTSTTLQYCKVHYGTTIVIVQLYCVLLQYRY